MAKEKSTDDSSKPEKDKKDALTDDSGAAENTTVKDTDGVEDEIDTYATDDTTVEAEIPDAEDAAPADADLEGAELSTEPADDDIPENVPEVEEDSADDVSLEEDAVQNDATSETDDAVELTEPESEDESRISEEEAEQLIEEAETVDGPTDPVAEPVVSPEKEVIRETVVEQKSGFMPALLGGVVAAGLGYFGAA